MKAVRMHGFGGPEVLKYEDAPKPTISHGDVLVRVKACALNHLDIWVRQGSRGQELAMPHILGSDISGVVEAVAEGVADVQPGQEVIVSPGLSCGRCERCLAGEDNKCPSYNIIGTRADGGYAEYVKVPTVNIIPKPQNLSFEEVASVSLVFLTAWHMLVAKARVKAGEDVLVHAAGSGVGIAAIQIAKLFGAKVIATAGTEEKLTKARSLGADEAINYSATDFAEEVRKLVGRKGVDVVFDSVGADVFEKSLRVLGTGGRLVTCGVTAGASVNMDIRYLFSRQLTLFGSYMGSKGELLQLMPFFQSGKLKPVVHAVLPLKDAAKAHQLMMDRKNFGKIVLVP
ncbi:MAG: zinc-binding dehydrogenase [Chloroflexi bacterium]|nr:zinc-binding dehydrogenase [Chloroflexota bacterium]